MSKVFVSYAHSSAAHKETVAALVAALRAAGLAVTADTDVKTPQGPPEGWPRWMKRQINVADWVLLFFDETYRRRFDGEEESGKGHGATWEGTILTHELYAHSARNMRFIPLVADDASTKLIPDELRGATFYRVPKQIAELATALLQTASQTADEATRERAVESQLRIALSKLRNTASFTRGKPDFVEGTNLPAGTPFLEEPTSQTLPWYLPAEGKAPGNWMDKWHRLRSRFERLIDDCQPVQCTLMQRRVPSHGYWEIADSLMDPTILLLAGGGLERPPTRLYASDGAPLAGAFPAHSPTGDELVTSEGKPQAIRFGLSRYFVLHRNSRYQSDPRPVPHPQFSELARDATALLYELPAGVAVWLWSNWLSGFSRTTNPKEFLWLDALFELSLRGQPGTPLFTKCFYRQGNGAIGLVGKGLFPVLPTFGGSHSWSNIPNDGGHPSAWYAELADVVRASVAAIDMILERAGTGGS